MSCIIFHRDELISLREFARWITDDVYTKSPFFKNKPHNHNIKILTSGPRSSGGLGTDLSKMRHYGVIHDENAFNCWKEL